MGCWNTCIFLVYVCTIGVSQTSKALRGPPCFGGPVLGVKFLGLWSVLVHLGLLFGIWGHLELLHQLQNVFFFFDAPEKLLAVTRSVDKALNTDVYLGWLQRMSYVIHLF